MQKINDRLKIAEYNLKELEHNVSVFGVAETLLLLVLLLLLAINGHSFDVTKTG